MPQHGSGDTVRGLYSKPSFLRRQLDAPLLKEREEYLWSLLQSGTSRDRVRTVAIRLANGVRLLRLKRLRAITPTELEKVKTLWLAMPSSGMPKKRAKQQGHHFQSTFTRWLEFHKCIEIVPPPVGSMWAIHQDYLTHISATQSRDSVRIFRFQIAAFLRWLEKRRAGLSSIKLPLIDSYLAYRQRSGLKVRSIVTHAQCLRGFCRYLEAQEIIASGIGNGIEIPAIRRYQREPRGPAWKEVRRLLRREPDEGIDGYRAIAIIALAAIYGLRNREIRGLALDDFNWSAETFTVRRAKSGRVQEFPLQWEVGELIIRYLQKGRPRCSCRNLFVSHKPPYGPLTGTTISRIVTERMQFKGLALQQYGPHALRHSCATQLLKKGSSLFEIADLLGHRDMRSVGIYAKFDMKGLKQVANFSLKGLG